jgi:hypothetical protein
MRSSSAFKISFSRSGQAPIPERAGRRQVDCRDSAKKEGGRLLQALVTGSGHPHPRDERVNDGIRQARCERGDGGTLLVGQSGQASGRALQLARCDSVHSPPKLMFGRRHPCRA